MTNVFIRIYRYFSRHRAVYWLSMAALFVFFGFFAMQIHLEEDIDKLMPSSRNEDGTTKLAFADLKIKDKTFLLFALKENSESSESSESSENSEHSLRSALLSSVCDAFVDSLARDTTLVEDIFYQLSDDLMPDGVDYLTQHLPAYIDTTAYSRFDSLLTREHMAAQMQRNRDDLTGEFGELFPELIQMDPIGMRDVLAEQMKPLLSAGSGYKTVEGHFFVPDTTVCVTFITPRFSSTNTGQGSALFERLNSLIATFAKSHPQVDITYHGTPASGYYNSTQIKHDLTTTITGALVLVLVFLLLCFANVKGGVAQALRRWDTIPLLLLPVVFGTLFGLAMMYWLKGEFSLLALGIGGVVLGVALSYVLHVMTHHVYVGDGETLLRDQVKPVWLGCLTTIGSFAGLLFIKTDLLRDFGLFAAFAIFGTTLFSLTYLPQLLPRRTSGFPIYINKVNTYDPSRNRWLLAVMGVVTVVCIGWYLMEGTHFDADMHNLGYLEEMTERSEQLLRDKTAVKNGDKIEHDKSKYFASKGRTMEEAIAHFGVLSHKLDSLQQLGLVKDYTHTDKVFVSLEEQQRRIDAWHRFWTDDRLGRVRQLIAQTAPQAGLNADAFDTFFEAATADYEPDALYEAGIIPAGYQSTLTERSYDGNYLCFTSVRCENDSVRSSDSDYMRICNAVAADPNLLVLDTYYYTTDTLLQMNDDFGRLQWLSMAFVFVVLLVSFRFNVKLSLLGFLPIVLSWLIVLGAMDMCQVSFNLISIIISTFIFGIGVDYSIFVMDGLTNPNQEKLAYHKTAIFLSAVTLIVTVSSMLLAQHPAIRSVGFSTLVGLAAAVLLSYIVQPAIYRKVKR